MASNNAHVNVCVICGDIDGIQVTCHGCQQSFCWKHMLDHRQTIEKEVNTLAQNHYLLKYDWNDNSNHSQLFNQINEWEKESISKIQTTADTARADLTSFIKQSEDSLQTSTRQISEDIETSRQMNNYSEIDIRRWTKKLNHIQKQVQESFNLQINKDTEIPSIILIKIEQNKKRSLDQDEQTVKRSKKNTNTNFTNAMTSSDNINNEQFGTVLEKSKLYEGNLLAINDIDSRSLISGVNAYSHGKHSLCFHIGKVYKTGWSCFFGVITSEEQMKDNVSEMKSVYGVWSSGYRVKGGQRSGTCGERRWNIDDHIILIFDCDNKTIQIENKRIHWCQSFDIDLHLCPFPWKSLTIIRKCQLRIKHLPERI